MARKYENGIDLQNTKIINSTSASATTDVPNWGQVQNLVNGLVWKPSVQAASTGNINLSSPGSTLDGYTFNTGDRFLAQNQTTQSQNGIYIWNGASTAATLAPDWQQGEVTTGATTFVNNGTANGDTQWTLITTGTLTIGTTNLVFTKTGAGFVYSAGSNITISSSGVISAVLPPAGPQKYAAALANGSGATTLVVTHGLNTTDVIVQLYIASTGELVDTDVTSRTTTTVTLNFATAPASNYYRVVVIG